MKTENKIIKALIEENHSMTIREISKKIKADYRITHTAVRKLAGKKIINTQTIGKSSLCSLNKYYGSKIYKVEDERKNQFLKNRNIKQLYKEVMAKIQTSFFIFLVFGSYAKNLHKKNSDIDLMFISDGKNFEDKIGSILSLLPLKTHALVFTEKEFKRMLDAKKLNVVKEAVNNYIILHGIENFYNIKNA